MYAGQPVKCMCVNTTYLILKVKPFCSCCPSWQFLPPMPGCEEASTNILVNQECNRAAQADQATCCPDNKLCMIFACKFTSRLTFAQCAPLQSSPFCELSSSALTGCPSSGPGKQDAQDALTSRERIVSREGTTITSRGICMAEPVLRLKILKPHRPNNSASQTSHCLGVSASLTSPSHLIKKRDFMNP